MASTLAGLLQALESSGVAIAIRQSTWLYPALEIIHIIGIVLLVGAAFLFDLRLLGSARHIAVASLARHLLPWSRRGLYLILPSGILLFSTNAVALAIDPVFQLKMLLLLAGVLNAGAFHFFIFPLLSSWEQSKTSLPAKVVAVCSISIWLAVIACGRLLAY